MIFRIIDAMIEGAVNVVDATIDAGVKVVDATIDTGVKVIDRKIEGTVETIDHAMDSVFSGKNKMTDKDVGRIANHLLNPLDGVKGAEDVTDDVDCDNDKS